MDKLLTLLEPTTTTMSMNIRTSIEHLDWNATDLTPSYLDWNATNLTLS